MSLAEQSPAIQSLLVSFLFVFVVFFWYSTSIDPLRKIPGPFIAKFSSIRLLYHAWKGDLHLDHVRCHQQHGSVYRAAPSRVVFNTLPAALSIYSNDRSITKSDGYASHPFTRESIPSLFNCIDASRAALKKKLIRPTTTAPAMSIQTKAIEDNVETFMEIVRSSPPQDLSMPVFYYALDVISQSMFGKKFETMRDPKHRWMCRSLERGNRHMYLQLAWPEVFTWLTPFVNIDCLTYPEFHDDSKMFLELCHSHLEAGLKRKGEGESIYELMKAEQPEEISQEELYVDAFSFMRGGGDMVAVTIAAALFYITRDNEVLRKLTTEIRSTFDEAVPSIGHKLETCKYLRACIDEALRMAPPGPGVFWRTSPNDLVVEGVRLPAGTDFGVSVFALHYNEDMFPEPCSFRPERFLDGGAREYSIPFLRGFRSCPAQKLAYPTILLPIARMVWQFDLYDLKAEPRPEPVPIKELYEGTFGAFSGRKYGVDLEKLYLQVDVFGSRIQGPTLRCEPRRDRDVGCW